MKHARASLIGLAALVGGCSLDGGLDAWTRDDIHVLSIDEARELRIYHTTFSDEPYWSGPRGGGETADGRPRSGQQQSGRQAAAWRTPQASVAQSADPQPRATALQTIPPPQPVPGSQLSCMTGDTACEQRLSALVADPTRVWVFAPPQPADYVSGVRLLAYHRLRDKITCTELKFGIQEAVATRDHLAVAGTSSAIGAGGMAKVEFVKDLAATIQKDLAAMLATKCPAQSDQTKS